ncbi:MAG: RsmB/NOP family class I SAM-dependent RNA methyltransferase [Betaproteobacteria bacterium]|nr:RsmB/NOP family class I SAM-dependent RNA methyltransferase [Betaproteobacteria bacterium]
MRFSRPLLDACAAALSEVLRFARPADAVLSHFFREHANLGRRDRALIAETVYAVVRRLRLLSRLSGSDSPRQLALAAWVALLGANLREVSAFSARAEEEQLARIKADAHLPQSFEVECDLPDWLIERLRRRFDDGALLALARGMQRGAPLDLRVNLARTSRAEVISALAADGIGAQATPYSPAGVRVAGNPAINAHSLFRAGLVEVQDEGSQILCCLVAPRRGEMVVDFCAGAGGKTLALGMLMRSIGRLYAFDVSAKRLAQLKPRLARSGLSNVHPQRIENERDPRLARLAGKIDRVLVDAPCTGLGTLRRNPDLKWRRSAADLEELRAKQAAILGAAARLVKPGGRLVYATCSLLDEENRAVVDAFRAAHSEFTLKPACQVLAQERIPLEMGEVLELWPHRHATDGFFAVVLERSAGGA